MTIYLHKFDLPDDVTFANERALAVDTETLGLKPYRDRLCVVQMSAGDGDAHLVQFPEPNYDAPNLKRVLGNQNQIKIFHFARFDLASIYQYLDVWAAPVFCTKIASKLTRTYTDRHGLKDLARELVGVDMSKQQQSSDWGAAELSPEQQEYAASDVLYLHQMMDTLEARLEREGRREIYDACVNFLPARAGLDLSGWPDEDIFAH